VLRGRSWTKPISVMADPSRGNIENDIILYPTEKMDARLIHKPLWPGFLDSRGAIPDTPAITQTSTDAAALHAAIEAAWDARAELTPQTTGAHREAVEAALALLDSGKARVAARGDNGQWTVHDWLKKAVLLSFRLTPNAQISGAPGGASWWDKVPSKFA